MSARSSGLRGWMTAIQHHGGARRRRGVSTTGEVLRESLTENRASTQKSKHVRARAIARATRPPADPASSDEVSAAPASAPYVVRTAYYMYM